MVDYYVMNIGGKDIKITSYDKMLQMEQGDSNIWLPYLEILDMTRLIRTLIG